MQTDNTTDPAAGKVPDDLRLEAVSAMRRAAYVLNRSQESAFNTIDEYRDNPYVARAVALVHRDATTLESFARVVCPHPDSDLRVQENEYYGTDSFCDLCKAEFAKAPVPSEVPA